MGKGGGHLGLFDVLRVFYFEGGVRYNRAVGLEAVIRDRDILRRGVGGFVATFDLCWGGKRKGGRVGLTIDELNTKRADEFGRKSVGSKRWNRNRC